MDSEGPGIEVREEWGYRTDAFIAWDGAEVPVRYQPLNFCHSEEDVRRFFEGNWSPQKATIVKRYVVVTAWEATSQI